MKNIYTENTEVVLKGHPDRMCDEIAKKIAKLIWDKDKEKGRSACELLYNGDNLIIAGEYKTSYTKELLKAMFDDTAKDCIKNQTDNLPRITQIWNIQSPEINKGSETGFGDNTIAYGYYNFETKTNKTPAHLKLEKLAEKVTKIHKKNWPDGKIILINGKTSISIETGIEREELIELGFDKITIFQKSGGFADTGVVGRKLIAERHGNGIPHGGGAQHGKDATKGDISLKIIGDEIAEKMGKKYKKDILLQLSCVFGSSEITVINVETGESVPKEFTEND